MPRPKSWRPWYARDRAAYNRMCERRERRLAHLSQRRAEHLQSLYDAAEVHLQQAEMYRARAEWWEALCDELKINP